MKAFDTGLALATQSSQSTSEAPPLPGRSALYTGAPVVAYEHRGLLTRLSLCSVRVQASMKVCAMTDREASTTSWTWTSKIK